MSSKLATEHKKKLVWAVFDLKAFNVKNEQEDFDFIFLLNILWSIQQPFFFGETQSC